MIEPRLNEVAKGYTMVDRNFYGPYHPTSGIQGRTKEQRRLDKIERRIWNKQKRAEFLAEEERRRQYVIDNPIVSASTISGQSGKIGVPLEFWFCRDFRLAIPHVAMLYESSKITLNIADYPDFDVTHTGG